MPRSHKDKEKETAQSDDDGTPMEGVETATELAGGVAPGPAPAPEAPPAATSAPASTDTASAAPDTEAPAAEKETEAEKPTLAHSKSAAVLSEKLVTSFATDASSRDVEVVFAFDTTGSMYGAIEDVRKNISAMAKKLLVDVPGIRIGMMAVGDYCDQGTYVVSSLDLCEDAEKLCKWVEDVKMTGGGDTPEAYELMLRDARKLSWSKQNRALVVIGDAFPHPPSYTDQAIYWRDELLALIAEKVKLYGVLVGTAAPESQSADFFREISEQSGGIFLELRHFHLISDMFMAVCYKEFSDERVEAFRAEIEAGGRMDADREAIFSTLKRGTSKTLEPVRGRKWDWWTNGGTGSPSFVLGDDGKWLPAGRKKSSPKKKATPKKRARVETGDDEKKKESPKEEKAEEEDDKKAVKDEEEEEEEETEMKAPPRKFSRKAASVKSPKKVTTTKKATTPKRPARKSKGEKKSEDEEANDEIDVEEGCDYYLRGSENEVWMARVSKLKGRNGQIAEVNWFEEFKRYPDCFALMAWKDDVPRGAFIAPAKIKLDPPTGMYKRTGKIPSF